ncbi:DUF4271 domain-containing protein [Sphingobacterium suaedae]|uniref:DUF4271 domain-containing protein n=1 Tax=Sphingobacterium suaedae TaxID=1686402 RepID=A0ABW5KLI9_9SPHI
MYRIKSIVLSGFFCLLVSFGFAQADSTERVQQAQQAVASERDSFNYVFPPPDRPNQLLDRFLAVVQAQSINPMQMIAQLSKSSGHTDSQQGYLKNARPAWVLLVVFLLFLSVAIVRLLFPADFARIVQAYFHERTLQQVSKEDNMLTSWPYIFLYLIFSLALGLFIVLVESSFVRLDLLSWDNYLRTALVVAFLFIVKILLIRFISFVFEIDRLVREYITVLYLVYFNSMLFLMPFLLLVTFLPTQFFKFVLILFTVVVCMLFIYRFLRTALRLFGNLKFSIFYLILYLCALEVAPILILVRTLSN